MRRDAGYRFGPRYHAMLDSWTPLCGVKATLPMGAIVGEFDGTAKTLDKRATTLRMAVCAKCHEMLERGIGRAPQP